MSEEDEYQRQLDRLCKLEADVNGITDDPNPVKEEPEGNSHDSGVSTEIKDAEMLDDENSPPKSPVAVEKPNGETHHSPSPAVVEKESSSSSDDEYRKKRRGYGMRVTRKATGSLPKETKTLLMETTQAYDPAKAKSKSRCRPGFLIVLAPECTSCGSDVILRPFQRRMLIHPYLKSAICRQCHEFYHSDVFAIDDEGSEIYCIWCGEGGELIYCDKCEKAFCGDCIKRNFGKKYKAEIVQQEKWECFICVPELMENLRKVAGMIVKYQNLCIKDPYLIENFECEVTKSDIEMEDYQSLVSARIRERKQGKLLTSSQQNAESQVGSDEQAESSNEGSNEVPSEGEGEEEEENGHSSASEYSESKSKVKPKHKTAKTENGDLSNSDSDDEKFIESIRKKAKERREAAPGTKDQKKSKEDSTVKLKDDKPVPDASSSDDSLFDTGNPNVKAKKFRKTLDSSGGEQGYDDDDEEDETIQKYRNKLSNYKEVPDKPEEQEEVHSNYSSESNSADEDVSDDQGSSSDSSKITSGSEGEQGNDDKSSKDKEGSENVEPGKKRKRSKKKKDSSSDEHESEDEDTGKKKRKRRKKKKQKGSKSSDSESEYDEDGKKKRKNKKGKRKKIRKIMGKNQLQKETVDAQAAEEQRRQKLKEKTLPSQQGKILNFILEDLRKEKYRSKPPTIDDEENGKVIEVHKHLKKKLKPHQLDGIQFMYDCCMESVEKVKSGSEGSGCILAHCMGLGKTFQVVTFVTTVLNYHYIFGLKRVLVVCPLNTVRNWQTEFDKWLKDMDDAPEVHILTDNITNNDKRGEIMEDWFESSGILIIGYSMYRILSQGNNIRKKHLKERFKKYLVDPGPDIVVCDEGHMIKNEKTGIARALNSMKTKRRIILTGTPLQNNLIEYHCMVSFVKPNLLGTTKEFKNMYENPINNGQTADATDYDMKLMKERSHILFEQLSACVQRRDYTVLKAFLPEKYEYVLSIKMSDLQIKLYQKFLEKAKSNGQVMSKLFECYQTLKKVWTHPWLLEIDAMKNEKDSIEDFITDKETSEDSWEASSDDSDFNPKKKKKKKGKKEDVKEEKKEEKKDEEPTVVQPPSSDAKIVSDIADTIVPDMGGIDYNWFKGEMSDKDEKMLEHSGKLLVTLEILDKASQKGDKVLLFSQSLLALDFLETSINRVGWLKGRDYFRMDGSTKTAHRSMFQKKFNDKSNKRCRLFLISTKAGGLGINLVSANRIILFDMSWNPSDDTQSLFRAYRYGQAKDVYVYRLVARGTMEEKIYDRQVYKESLSSRVVDEKQITRYFSANDLQDLFSFDPSAQTCTTSVLANHNPPADDVLASILVDLDPPLVLEYHEHDSLLEHRPEQQLTEEERKAAWANFKIDKERRNVVNAPMGTQSVFQRLKAHSQSYLPVITPIYSNNQELILGGFTNEQIISIQQQLAPVVQTGRLRVKSLGNGQLHIEGLGPEQQQVFINSIKEQQAAQFQAAQVAHVQIPAQQQQIMNQLPPAERAIYQQRIALLLQQQQQQQLQQLQHAQQLQQQQAAALQAQQQKPLIIRPDSSTADTPIAVPDSPPPEDR